MLVNVAIGLLQMLSVVVAIGFTGKFEGIPSEMKELYQDKQVHVVNGANYQSKMNVDLYKYNFDQEKHESGKSALVNKDYTFEYQDLSIGVYTLIVNSYDFELNNNRYTIKVKQNEIEGDELENIEILSMENPLGSTKFNQSSIITISNESPLVIDIVQANQFYALESNSLMDMLMNSPFGFIFRNKTLTILFAITIGIMVTPYIANIVAPGFMDSFNEVQEEISQEKSQKLKIVNQEEIDKKLKVSKIPPAEKSKSTTNSNVRKRRT